MIISAIRHNDRSIPIHPGMFKSEFQSRKIILAHRRRGRWSHRDAGPPDTGVLEQEVLMMPCLRSHLTPARCSDHPENDFR